MALVNSLPQTTIERSHDCQSIPYPDSHVSCTDGKLKDVAEISCPGHAIHRLVFFLQLLAAKGLSQKCAVGCTDEPH